MMQTAPSITEEKKGRSFYFDVLPDDDTLRILQFCGRKMLSQNEYDENVFIPLEVSDEVGECIAMLDVAGNLKLNGNIGGDVDCGNVDVLYCAGNVDCGNVEKIISCAGDIDCGNVGVIESCAGDIDCGSVGVIGNCAGNIK